MNLGGLLSAADQSNEQPDASKDKEAAEGNEYATISQGKNDSLLDLKIFFSAILYTALSHFCSQEYQFLCPPSRCQTLYQLVDLADAHIKESLQNARIQSQCGVWLGNACLLCSSLTLPTRRRNGAGINGFK